MKRFKYKAKDSKGNLVIGEVEASNIEQAAKLVREEGLIIISLKARKEILNLDFIKRIRERVSSEDVTTLTRQLATMINAGLPLTDALVILRSQAKGSMQKIVGQVLADIEEGQSLSTALSKHPSAFSRTYIALIKSGEVGGVLDVVLSKLAEDMEKQREFRGKVKGALIYPIIVVVGMIIVAFIMIIFVIPRITTLYDQFDAELPISTKILIGFSDFMVRFWPIVIALVGGLVYGFKIYRATKEGSRKIDEIILKIPVIGELQKQVILTELTRTLSLVIGSGISIIEGLTISTQLVRNKVISEAIEDITKMVEKGFPLAFAFSRHPDAFPVLLSQMIAVGEETGKMDEVLAKVSHVFEVESEQKIKTLTTAIEPIILIVLGVGVAFLVISIILPIYNLTTQL